MTPSWVSGKHGIGMGGGDYQLHVVVFPAPLKPFESLCKDGNHSAANMCLLVGFPLSFCGFLLLSNYCKPNLHSI